MTPTDHPDLTPAELDHLGDVATAALAGGEWLFVPVDVSATSDGDTEVVVVPTWDLLRLRKESSGVNLRDATFMAAAQPHVVLRLLRMLRDAKARIEEMEIEEEGLDRLVSRQSDLLTGVAVALRGPPPPGLLYNHADLPERVAKLVAEKASSPRREIAPHAFLAAARAYPCEICGRDFADELHGPSV